MQKIFAIALIVLGLIGLVLGRLGDTVWAPPAERTAAVTLSEPGAAVVLDPGVLYMSGDEGTATVAAGSDVAIIPASPGDVEAYLEGVPHTRITGASAWEELSTEKINPDGEQTVSNVAEADLWRSSETAPSPATIDIAAFADEETSAESAQPYRAVLLVPTDPEAAITDVSITWPVTESNPWVPYAYAGGAALAIVGMLWLALSWGRSRREPEAVSAGGSPEDAAADPVPLGAATGGAVAVAASGTEAAAGGDHAHAERAEILDRIGEPEHATGTPEHQVVEQPAHREGNDLAAEEQPGAEPAEPASTGDDATAQIPTVTEEDDR